MKFIKKSIAVLLALMMAFGSVSLMANASADSIYHWEMDTKFYRMQRNADGYVVDADGNVIGDADDNLTEGSTPVWVETTTAFKGEKVKARIFITTKDFALGAAQLFYVYPTAALTHDIDSYEKVTGGYKLLVNTHSESKAAKKGFAGFNVVGIGNTNKWTEMVNEGYVNASDADGLGWIWTSINEGQGSIKLDGSENQWLYEYNFIVNEPTDELLGKCYI